MQSVRKRLVTTMHDNRVLGSIHTKDVFADINYGGAVRMLDALNMAVLIIREDPRVDAEVGMMDYAIRG